SRRHERDPNRPGPAAQEPDFHRDLHGHSAAAGDHDHHRHVCAAGRAGRRPRHDHAATGGPRTAMSWIPVIVIWASLFAVSAYYVREWWRVGRDPKGVAVVPHPVPPEGLSPMGLAFIQRRGAADETAIVTAGMG